VVEGVFAGLLPIRSPSAGARDQIDDGETGYLIDPHDPEALADRLVAIAGDPDRRRRVADAARRKMEARFTISALCDRTEAVYDAALAEHGGRRG